MFNLRKNLKPLCSVKNLLLALVSLCFVTSAHAQWQSTTYSLKGGWNSIYLHGDAKQDTIANLLPADVLEVWRWNPNPNQIGFITSPLVPAAGTPSGAFGNAMARSSPFLRSLGRPPIW